MDTQKSRRNFPITGCLKGAQNMRPSHIDHDDFAYDEIESLRRRSRNRALALARVKARKRHLGPGDDDDLDGDDWTNYHEDYDDYDADEWDNHA
jgi:hypothetical protein